MNIDYIDEWWQAISTNLKGYAICSSAVLPYMKNGGFGRIINVGSFEHRQPLPGHSASSVLKGGIHALNKAMAKEINRVAYPNISINEFVPNPLNTQVGSESEQNPDQCYQAIRNIVTAECYGAHGRIFTKEGEIKSPIGTKQKLKLKIKRVLGLA
jgi:NAD(P)-dependent dehydrogenase (short-subunit alcohol dehydrogenase family)